MNILNLDMLCDRLNSFEGIYAEVIDENLKDMPRSCMIEILKNNPLELKSKFGIPLIKITQSRADKMDFSICRDGWKFVEVGTFEGNGTSGPFKFKNSIIVKDDSNIIIIDETKEDRSFEEDIVYNINEKDGCAYIDIEGAYFLTSRVIEKNEYVRYAIHVPSVNIDLGW
jgi:hypothetical protein